MNEALKFLLSYPIIALSAIFIVVSAWLLYRYLGVWISDREHHSLLRAEFYDAAHKILKEEDLSAEKLADIEHMSRNINNKKTAISLFIAVNQRLKEKKSGIAARARSAAHPESHLFIDATYLMALTYLHPIIGRLTRAALAEVFRSQDRDRIASTARDTLHDVHA